MTQDIQISLPQFEGPLFQLHHQIKKDQINILDVPIAMITAHGLAQMHDETFFAKGPDLIYYASLFLNWKTRKLLPKEEKLEIIEDESDSLAMSFMEHAQFKEIVTGLFELEQKRLPHFSRDVTLTFEKDDENLEEVQFDELALLFQKIMEKVVPLEMQIEEEFDLTSRMDSFLEEARSKQEMDFEELFSLQKSKGELIIMFLALLELIKLQLISIQRNADKFIIKCV